MAADVGCGPADNALSEAYRRGAGRTARQKEPRRIVSRRPAPGPGKPIAPCILSSLSATLLLVCHVFFQVPVLQGAVFIAQLRQRVITSLTFALSIVCFALVLAVPVAVIGSVGYALYHGSFWSTLCAIAWIVLKYAGYFFVLLLVLEVLWACGRAVLGFRGSIEDGSEEEEEEEEEEDEAQRKENGVEEYAEDDGAEAIKAKLRAILSQRAEEEGKDHTTADLAEGDAHRVIAVDAANLDAIREAGSREHSGEEVLLPDGSCFVRTSDPRRPHSGEVLPGWQQVLIGAMTEAIRRGEEQVVLLFSRSKCSSSSSMLTTSRRCMQRRAVASKLPGTGSLSLLRAPLRIFVLDEEEFGFFLAKFAVQTLPSAMVFGAPGVPPMMVDGFQEEELFWQALNLVAAAEAEPGFSQDPPS